MGYRGLSAGEKLDFSCSKMNAVSKYDIRTHHADAVQILDVFFPRHRSHQLDLVEIFGRMAVDETTCGSGFVSGLFQQFGRA